MYQSDATQSYSLQETTLLKAHFTPSTSGFKKASINKKLIRQNTQSVIINTTDCLWTMRSCFLFHSAFVFLSNCTWLKASVFLSASSNNRREINGWCSSLGETVCTLLTHNFLTRTNVNTCCLCLLRKWRSDEDFYFAASFCCRWAWIVSIETRRAGAGEKTKQKFMLSNGTSWKITAALKF